MWPPDPLAVAGEIKVCEGRIRTQLGKFPIAKGCASRAMAGANGDCPGQLPWHFTGRTIERAPSRVSGEPQIDLECEARAMWRERET